MDLFGWVKESRERYAAAGDVTRQRLPEYWNRAFAVRETDPDQGLALLQEGSHLADELGEDWWMMLLHALGLDGRMFWKSDYRQAVELAVRQSVAASRPENTNFPGRWLIYRNLVSAYLGVDPEGYAEGLRETLAFLDRELPREPNNARYLMLGSLRHFHTCLREFDAAEEAVARALALLERETDYQGGQFSLNFHYGGLCWIAWQRQDWRKVAECAALGEEVARKTGEQRSLCGFLMWQAVLARRERDERRAGRLRSTADAKMARLRMAPELEYADTLALFHELGGDMDKVLEVRDRELAAVANTGRFADESAVHLTRAALLAKMGRLRAEDLHAARQAALQLRKPDKALSEIDKLTVLVQEGL